MLKLQNRQRRGLAGLLIKEVDPEVDPLAAGNDRPSLGHCQAIARRVYAYPDNTSFRTAVLGGPSNPH
jgi:hypothetical protein